MNRPRRNIIRLDYNVLDKTGERIAKCNVQSTKVATSLDNSSVMETAKLIDEMIDEIDLIVLEIEGFLEEYELDDLYTTEDIEKCIAELKVLKKRFEVAHVKLRRILGEDYKELYKTYDEDVNNLTVWIKEARKEVNKRKREIDEDKDEKLVRESEDRTREMEQLAIRDKEEKEEIARQENVKEREKIKAEGKYFKIRVEKCMESLDIEHMEFIEDIGKNISEVKYMIETHGDLHSRMEVVCGDDYGREFGDEFGQTSYIMNQWIQDAKKRINILRQADKAREIELRQQKELRHKEIETENMLHEKERNEKRYDEKVTFVKYMLEEIKSSTNSLSRKYSISLKSLDDDILLDKRSHINLIDAEFNEVMSKVTELVKEIPSKFEIENKILDKIFDIRNGLRDSKDKYLADLEKEICDRDLSSKKLQNASLLKIEVPKFKGYKSSIDIYTFQTEFEKLIAPSIGKKLLPDYLKRNYLDGQAYLLVKEIQELDKIWDKLKESFGSTEILLKNKLCEVEKCGPISKIKDKDKLIPCLSKLINSMYDLRDLVVKHDIESELYHSSNMNIVYHLIGDHRKRKIKLQNLNSKVSRKEEWMKIIRFLELELRLEEELLLDEMSVQQLSNSSHRSKDNENRQKSYLGHKEVSDCPDKCFICGENDHVTTVTSKGKKLVNYIACEKFVKMNPSERFSILLRKKLCFQCLNPGLKGRHDGVCYDRYACKHESHKKFKSSKHVLVCDEHKSEPSNIQLFEEYKSKFVTNSKSKYENFSQNMKLSYYAGGYVGKRDEEQLESSIYMLQTIKINDEIFNLFYDSGCGDLVTRRSAVERLENMGRASRELKGPIILTGVGDSKTVCEHGIYKVRLSTFDGYEANLSGLCLDKVTQEFPKYELKEVAKQIQDEYERKNKNSKGKLPKLPRVVGGDTDLMIGIKYLKYFPKEIFQLPSGLTIYESVFASADGSRGIIGGPHRIFAEIERQFRGSHLSMAAYLTDVVAAYQNGYKLSLDVPLLGMKGIDVYDDNDDDDDDHDYDNQVAYCHKKRFPGDPDLSKQSDHNDYDGKQVAYCHEKRLPGDPVICCRCVCHSNRSEFSNRIKKLEMMFEKVESAGTEVMYRCIKCRDCIACKTSERIEYISIQEEVEQDLIDDSVTVDIEKGITLAKLPFIKDPVHRLSPNENIALKVYKGQVKKLQNCPEDRSEVIKSEKKMQDLGFVEFFEKLTEKQRLSILKSCVKYFIPWKAVFNGNSISTPCRLVFDASQKTNGEYSLNSLLAKGRNNMNKLVEIFIRWTIHKYAFHTDIQKMYNTIKLREEHWCYQLYLWDNELSPSNEPKWKVIMTLIYGVKSSGNQAERGLRQTADLMKEEYPHENEIINKDIYVDDCLSGADSFEDVREITDNLKLVLNRGGFCPKGFTNSGLNPPDDLSSDGVSVNVAGMKWFSKEDKLAFKRGELNFSKKKRGKKSVVVEGIIPDNFTRRDCVGKVAEMFDLLGKITPITAGMKIDLCELTNRKLDWDDLVPEDLKMIWKSNFEMMREIQDLRYSRVVIPTDAVNLEIETIDLADASEQLVCAAIYARVRRKNGEYSCQLIFARSKVVPKDMTMPRAELFAAVLNASTGHVVQLSYGKYFKKCIKLTDSQIVLHWISNSKLAMKKWVRGKTIEIIRLTVAESWRYIKSKDNIADLGTRKGCKIEDVSEDSQWINGYPWMRLEEKDFPTMSVEDIKLSVEEKNSHDSECLSAPFLYNEWTHDVDDMNYSSYLVSNVVPAEVGERYRYSNYVIDPNKFRLRKVVRILALVRLFIKNLKLRIGIRIEQLESPNVNIHSAFKFNYDQYLVTEGKTGSSRGSKLKCKDALVVSLTDSDINEALRYFYQKASLEVKHFLNKKAYQKLSTEIGGILYYTGRILPSQEFSGKLNLSDVSIDLSSVSFCVPLTDSLSPFAYSVVNETHWYNNDARHSGVETVLRYSQKIAYIIEGRSLVKKFRGDCIRCKILAKKAIEVAMGPIPSDCLNIAPAFYVSQVDIFGPVSSYSNVNRRATVKIWFLIFCCCATGAIDVKTMEDYSTESFLLGFMRFACKVGYPKKLMPDEGSQLLKGCSILKLEYYDVKHKLNERYGVEFETCPVGAHYMHGKVERKIRHVQESFMKTIEGKRLSIIQWETLGDQIANSVNNQPLSIGNIVEDVENLDILTPNRLILGRNNDRSPIGSLVVTSDPKRIIEANNDIFRVWFESWLISYVPTLIHQPKWFKSDRDVKIGDVILFLKSDKEFDKQYQYGLIKDVKVGKDGKIREIDIEYRNHNEVTSRCTRRGTRDVVVIHPVDELGISAELGAIGVLSN